MAILRYAIQGNSTGAALTSALITQGKDYALKTIRRTLTAADVGANAGQTQDNGELDSSGCLVAQFSGALIKEVLAFDVYRPGSNGEGVAPNPGTGWSRTINNFSDGDAGHISSYAWRISTDGSSLYLKDSSTDAGTQLAANDFVVVSLLLGNT